MPNQGLWEGRPVDPYLLLSEREKKAKNINFFCRETACNIISITLNIPGEVRDNHFFRYILQKAKNEALRMLQEIKAKVLYSFSSFNGQENYVLLCVDQKISPVFLKTKTTQIEEHHPLGRIFDIDVIKNNGEKLERKEKRKCIVCGENAIICRREKRHKISDILARIEEIVKTYYDSFLLTRNIVPNDIWLMFQAIIAGILLEVSCTPKPGLVDRIKNGSHADMSYNLFLNSTEAIAPFLYEMMIIGYKYSGSLNKMLEQLRPVGLRAEQAMFQRTCGVNTQKGLIFSAGLVAASVGLLIKMNIPLTFRSITAIAKAIAADTVGKELEKIKKERVACTAGLKAFLEHNIRGIRGEVMNGYPSVALAKKDLEQKINEGYNLNNAMIQALFKLMTVVEDTTVVKRGGIKALKEVKELAQDFIEKGGINHTNAMGEILRINKIFINNNWTVGGCADLLAITTMIYLIENPKILKKEVITRDFKINTNNILKLLESNFNV